MATKKDPNSGMKAAEFNTNDAQRKRKAQHRKGGFTMV